jgi:hypothetical protein
MFLWEASLWLLPIWDILGCVKGVKEMIVAMNSLRGSWDREKEEHSKLGYRQSST